MVAHYSAWASAEREAVSLLNYGYIRVSQLMKSANKAVPWRFRRLS